MKIVSAEVASKWQLFFGDGLTEDMIAEASCSSEIKLPSGEVIAAREIDSPSGIFSFKHILEKSDLLKKCAILVGTVDAEDDGCVVVGAGIDWWWTAWINGEKAYSRGREFEEGNVKGLFTKGDWIFPVKVKKGVNKLAYFITFGLVGSARTGILPLPLETIEFNQEAVSEEALAGLRLEGRTDKDPISYKAGEDINFIFELYDEHGVSARTPLYLSWSAEGDDGGSRCGVDYISVDSPLTITTKLERDGYVHVIAQVVIFGNYAGEAALPAFDGGAGADVTKICASAVEPEDFDAYWRRQREILDAVPVRADVEEYLGTTFPDGVAIPPSLKIYTVRCDCAGRAPMTALMSVPKAEGKYPVRVAFDGYSKEPKLSHRLMTPGMITLHVNAHGYEYFRSPEYYREYFKPVETKAGYALSPEENADPDTAYFNGMAMRVMRSLDFAKTLEMWNGKDLFVHGGSQGGIQAVWAAALDHDVTRCECWVNWCSNIAGTTIDKRMPAWHPVYVRGLDYYDNVFHAKRIPESCFVDLSRMGLGDYTCPPSGITAFYNAIKAPKRIAIYQNSTHGFFQFEPQITRRIGSL